jgi:hypothetical protein
MNPNHYPPSPAYYRRHPNIDARDLVSPDYWTDSALVHLFRAGRKDGEPFADAVRNAFVCLALWFRSQSLPVPFYSAEMDRLNGELDRLRAEMDIIRANVVLHEWASGSAPFPTESPRPVAPPLDPFAALLEVKTDDQLAEWVDANLERCGDTISRTGTARNANTWAIGEGRYTASHAARTLHRILTGGKP